MVEQVDLLGVPLVIADLRRDFVLGDRLRQPRGARSIEPVGQPIARQMPLAYQSIQRFGTGLVAVPGGSGAAMPSSFRLRIGRSRSASWR